MALKHVTRKHSRGQASLEMLLILLILIPLLFGGVELGRGIAIRQALDGSAEAATRGLSLDPTQWDWAVSVIEAAVASNPLGGGSVGPVSLQVFDAGGNSIGASGLEALPFGSSFRLQASCAYSPEILLIGGQPVTITVSYWGIVERYP